MAAEIHVGDVGTTFVATVTDESGAVINIASATVLRITFGKPDGSVLVKTATLMNTGSDGKMKYATQDGDLDQSGKWKVQGYVEVGAYKLHTEIVTFTVAKNIA